MSVSFYITVGNLIKLFGCQANMQLGYGFRVMLDMFTIFCLTVSVLSIFFQFLNLKRGKGYLLDKILVKSSCCQINVRGRECGSGNCKFTFLILIWGMTMFHLIRIILVFLLTCSAHKMILSFDAKKSNSVVSLYHLWMSFLLLPPSVWE